MMRARCFLLTKGSYLCPFSRTWEAGHTLPASLSGAYACTLPGPLCPVSAWPPVWSGGFPPRVCMPVPMSGLCSGSPSTDFYFNLCRFSLPNKAEPPGHEAEENKLAPGRHFQNILELANFNLETVFGYRHSGLRHIPKYKEPRH